MPSQEGLIAALFALCEKFIAGQHAEVQSLKHLADRKFAQIDETHHTFMRILDNLREVVSDAFTHLKRTDDHLQIVDELGKAIAAIDATRLASSDRRREQYEEAKVYAENLVSSSGIIVRMPSTVAVRLMDFMASICTYFETDGMYRHELGYTLAYFKHVLRVQEEKTDDIVGRGEKARLENELQSLLQRVRHSQEYLRRNWANIAASYHRLNLEFRENGVQ